MDGTGLLGVSQLYRGVCAVGWTIQQCDRAVLSTGVVPRSDSLVQENNVNALRARHTACNARGLQGEALRRCAATQAR